jgi:hypothetical protein
MIQAYVARPDGSGPYPGIVLVHHAPGWDEFYQEFARRFANHGFVAICPNLYYREGHGTPDDVAAQVRAAGGVADGQVVADCEAAMGWLKSLPTSNGKVGIIGTCSGGRHSVDPRRPHHRRDGPGPRHRDVRGVRLRREWPAVKRKLHGLPDPDGDGRPQGRHRPPGASLALHRPRSPRPSKTPSRRSALRSARSRSPRPRSAAYCASPALCTTRPRKRYRSTTARRDFLADATEPLLTHRSFVKPCRNRLTRLG